MASEIIKIGNLENQQSIIDKQLEIDQRLAAIEEELQKTGGEALSIYASTAVNNINAESVNWAIDREEVGEILYEMCMIDGVTNTGNLKSYTSLNQIASDDTVFNAILNSPTIMSFIFNAKKFISSVIVNPTAMSKAWALNTKSKERIANSCFVKKLSFKDDALKGRYYLLGSVGGDKPAYPTAQEVGGRWVTGWESDVTNITYDDEKAYLYNEGGKTVLKSINIPVIHHTLLYIDINEVKEMISK